MDSWDIFHSDRLEIERGLSTAKVRQARARGELRDDDLIRPAGSSTPWARLGDFGGLPEAPSPPRAEGRPPARPPAADAGRPKADRGKAADEPDLLDRLAREATPAADDDEQVLAAFPFGDAGGGGEPPLLDFDDDDRPSAGGPGGTPPAHPLEALIDEDDEPADAPMEALIDEEDDDDDDDDERGALDLNLDRGGDSEIALPVTGEEAEEAWGEDEYDPQDEDEAAAEFTLARSATEKVEELDLAAMVDVAFQLVLFFLVTATTVLFKTLEVPKPNPESAPAAATQGQSRSLDDLQRDYILVDIDPQGTFKIDHEPVTARLEILADKLRTARQNTGRTAMLLTADAVALHKHAVLAYDAANEIGLRIAISKPANSSTPPPPPPVRGAAPG